MGFLLCYGNFHQKTTSSHRLTVSSAIDRLKKIYRLKNKYFHTRWRREQKRKVMVEVQEEVKEEKRRQRKAQLEDKDNPWVDDDDSAEEADMRPAPKQKMDDDDVGKNKDDEDEDPLDAYMSRYRTGYKPTVPTNLTCLGSRLPNLTISDLQGGIARLWVKIGTS